MNIMNNETNIKLPDKLKSSPFGIPNGYFDSLPNRIMEKCTNETVKKRTLWQIVKPMLSFAAGFLLLVGISQITVNVVTDKKTDTTLSQANIDESIFDLYENNDEFSDEIKDEIITYIVDEHYVSMIFIEDQYLP
ncbi:MAG: hypothetical protein LBH30_06250 [Prevotellaceae bacterium]|jgi:hypothetical protein|nr:hypothetical protein [Prevotellaceae bacterium]